ncbi:MAG: 50S ribosomal protein L21 [Alphaproteobacteria bacterium]|nr:50S ribosomal protein L21 [Alphaproteobacteria bacterium]
MYAIIKTGGKQYKVTKNDIIAVEKLSGDEGSVVNFTEILAVGDASQVKIGNPQLSAGSVAATILKQTRGDKVIIFKKNRRHNYRRKNGHRQFLTVVRIDQIVAA